jgi:hypothetical protein
MKKNNCNSKYTYSIPKKQLDVNPSIAFGRLVTLRRTWDIFWTDFPGNQNELNAWQIRICEAVVQKLLNKGVEFPSLEVSELSIDESNLIWYSYKYAELLGVVGGAE